MGQLTEEQIQLMQSLIDYGEDKPIPYNLIYLNSYGGKTRPLINERLIYKGRILMERSAPLESKRRLPKFILERVGRKVLVEKTIKSKSGE